MPILPALRPLGYRRSLRVAALGCLAWACAAAAAAGADADLAGGGDPGDGSDTAPAAPAIAPADLGGAHWEPVAGIADVQRLVTSPVDPAVCYAALGPSSASAALWISRDAGQHWAPLAAAGTLPGPVTALLIDPLDAGRLYAGTANHGVQISDDGGIHWRPCGPGLAHQRIHALVFAPDDRTCSTIYATHSLEEPGLSISRDRGESWATTAPGFAIGDLAVLDDCLFCAASSHAQGTGFFRADSTKGWFCVLPEMPRALAVSPLDPHRLFFASRDGGLSVSDNGGISTRKIGPVGIDVEGLAIDARGDGSETVVAYAPQATGVIASHDGGATWTGWTVGLPASPWVADGACIALACDGSVAYATKNGDLLRLVRASDTVPVTAIPAVLPAGGGPVVLSVAAEADTTIVADTTALGGPGSLAFAPAPPSADGRARQWARLDRVDPAAAHGAPLRVVHVHATHGGTTRTGRVAVRVLPAAEDVALWDAGRRGYGEARVHGALVGRIGTVALTQEPYVHLACDGSGRIELPLWTGTSETIAAQNHALISFGVRSATPGPLALRMVVHDNGQGSGAENSQPSHVLDLRQYLPQGVDDAVRTVCIPVGDLLDGTTCSPNLLDLTFVSTGGPARTYDLLPITLLAQAGPQVLDAVALPLGEGRLRVRVLARGLDGAPIRATARLWMDELPLTASATHVSPRCSGAALGWTGRLAQRSADEVVFEGELPDALPPGDHQVALTVHGAHAMTMLAVPFTEPRSVLRVPALTAAADPADPDIAVPSLLAHAPTMQITGAADHLTIALGWRPEALLVAVTADHPEALQVSGTLPLRAQALEKVPHLALTLDLPRQGTHTLRLLWGEHRVDAWWDASRLDSHAGDTRQHQTPWVRLPIALRPDAIPGAGLQGTALVVHGTFVRPTAPPAADAPHAMDPGVLAILTDPSGPLTLRLLPLAASEPALVIGADRPLADAAADPRAWQLPGGVRTVVLSPDHRRAVLVPSTWPLPTGAIAAPGVLGADGTKAVGSLAWPLDARAPRRWGGG